MTEQEYILEVKWFKKIYVTDEKLKIYCHIPFIWTKRLLPRFLVLYNGQLNTVGFVYATSGLEVTGSHTGINLYLRHVTISSILL